MTEEDVFTFACERLRSVWALELLLLLRRSARGWDRATLVRELRSSATAIDEALRVLRAAGLVVEEEPNRFRYRAASALLDDLTAALQQTYAEKPMSVINAMMACPTGRLRMFSDAFKLKE